MDPRYQRLAELLVRHSCRVKAGEHLLLELFDVPPAMAVALVEATRAAGGHPHVELRSNRVMRALNKLSGEDGLRVWGECDQERMKKMQCYVGIRGADNVSEMSGIPGEQMKSVGKLYAKPVHFEQRVNHTKWVVLRWPSPSMAQLAQMSTEDFERFYFDVCLVDYAKMDRDAQPLKRRMEAADKVHIKGPGKTDLRFSIKGIGVVPCCGERNIPDGECFTCPTLKSSEGVIAFNTPTIYSGTKFEGIRLELKGGRIVKATCAGGSEKRLNEIEEGKEERKKFMSDIAGFADATWTVWPKSEWDVAAGAALVRAAGGSAWPTGGGALQLNRAVPRFAGFAGASARVAARVQAMLGEAM